MGVVFRLPSFDIQTDAQVSRDAYIQYDSSPRDERREWLTHEQVVRVRHITTNSEKLHQVMKLAVDIATNLQ